MEHFVYLPKKCTANAQDIPFFLSTRLADVVQSDTAGMDNFNDSVPGPANDIGKILRDYENRASDIAVDLE